MTKKSRNIKTNPNIPIEAIDQILSAGYDPMELMNDMKKAIMERALNAEMDQHLGYSKNDTNLEGNYRNGYGSKTVNTEMVQLP